MEFKVFENPSGEYLNKWVELGLVESELKIILEAMIEKEARMVEILSNCDLDDEEQEDLIADTGNDLAELRLLLKPLKARAVEEYGSNILNFSSEPFS